MEKQLTGYTSKGPTWIFSGGSGVAGIAGAAGGAELLMRYLLNVGGQSQADMIGVPQQQPFSKKELTMKDLEGIAGRVTALQHLVAVLVFTAFKDEPKAVETARDILNSVIEELSELIESGRLPFTTPDAFVNGYTEAVEQIKTISLSLLERLPQKALDEQ